MEVWGGGMGWRYGVEVWGGGMGWRYGVEVWGGGMGWRNRAGSGPARAIPPLADMMESGSRHAVSVTARSRKCGITVSPNKRTEASASSKLISLKQTCIETSSQPP